jgi:hypothetical protein
MRQQAQKLNLSTKNLEKIIRFLSFIQPLGPRHRNSQFCKGVERNWSPMNVAIVIAFSDTGKTLNS